MLTTGNSVYLETGKLCVACSTPLDETGICPNCFPVDEREDDNLEWHDEYIECEEEFMEPDWLNGPNRELEE